MRRFQAALDTRLDSPLFASLSVHGLDFKVHAHGFPRISFTFAFVMNMLTTHNRQRQPTITIYISIKWQKLGGFKKALLQNP